MTISGTMLLKGGLVFNGTDAPQDGLGVMFDGAEVSAVAPVAEFDGFTGETVDTTGATLMPGLIDCHVHICMGAEGDPGTMMDKLANSAVALRAMDHARATLDGGTVAVRDCGGPKYIDLDVRDALNAERFPGPVMRASGKMICMTGGHGNKYGHVADGTDEVIKAVRTNIHMGSDLIKIMATGGVMTPGVNPEDAHYSAEEIGAGIQEAKRFSKKTASHAQGAEGILNAVRGGIDSIEHGIFMDDQCIEEMLAAGTFLVPTLSAVYNIVLNKDLGIPSWAVEKSLRVFDIHRDAILKFYKAGGKIAMGTDAGTPFNKHGDNARELEFMTEIGIPALDAMRSATSIAADLVEPDTRGVIAPGAAADLLLVPGNPVDDISAIADKSRHLLLTKSGRIYRDNRGN